jgi:hypothetical protein
MYRLLNLGAWRHLNGADGAPVLNLPARHLVTHAVVVGMTIPETLCCSLSNA